VVWTVDADTGRVEAPWRPAGGPSAGSLRRAAAHLAAGGPATPIGILGQAERGVMQGRSRSAISGGSGLLQLALVFVGLRFVFTVYGDVIGGRWLALPRDLVLLAGVIGAALLAMDYQGLRSRLPGFSSSRPWVPILSWVGYVGAVLIAVALLGLLIPTSRSA
jgi:hypothetical protein